MDQIAPVCSGSQNYLLSLPVALKRHSQGLITETPPSIRGCNFGVWKSLPRFSSGLLFFLPLCNRGIQRVIAWVCAPHCRQTESRQRKPPRRLTSGEQNMDSAAGCCWGASCGKHPHPRRHHHNAGVDEALAVFLNKELAGTAAECFMFVDALLVVFICKKIIL